MKIEYSGVLDKNLENGIKFSSLNKNSRKKNISKLFLKEESDMLGWLDLPNISDEEISTFNNYGKLIRKKYKNFVVLGIGGSALGIKMLKHTFVDSINKDININIYVLDNIDTYFTTLIDKIDLKRTMFNVITKSGSTSETLSQMAYILDLMKIKKLDVSKHFCITTTKGNKLYDYAVSCNIKTFDIPSNVGGRFSVLSAVGLLPCAVMGIDIKSLLNGANLIKENSSLDKIENLAYTCAYINYSYLKKGLTNLVCMPYSDRLSFVSDFFAQLWAESLGKKFDNEGNIVFSGQTPIKSLGVTDQHSQLQLYSEGIKDKLIMFIKVKNRSCERKIGSHFDFAKHISNISLNELLNIEQDATSYALTKIDRPNYTICFDDVSEQSMGELIFFLEMMTAFMGEMLNINAYNQDGVELSKIYTKACLNDENYVKEHKEILKHIKNKKYL